MAPSDLPHSDDEFDDRPRMSNLGRALGVGAFLLAVVFWIYVFANRDSIPHPDEFADPAWVASAEAICAERQEAILALPNAAAADSPQDRAVLVAAGTAELETMVLTLDRLDPPTDPRGAEIVPQWLADYELYLQDRRDWTEILATGDDPPFLISGTADGVRVTDLLTTFAEVNDMPSCAPSGDV